MVRSRRRGGVDRARAPSGRPWSRALAALAVAGCGGGERQDADEPSGTFQVDVVQRELPGQAAPGRARALRHRRAQHRLARRCPNVAVTVNCVRRRAPSRPAWPIPRARSGSSTRAPRRRHRLHRHLGARPPGAGPDAALRVARDRRAGRHAHGQAGGSRPGSTARPKATLAGNRSARGLVHRRRVREAVRRREVDPQHGRGRPRRRVAPRRTLPCARARGASSLLHCETTPNSRRDPLRERFDAGTGLVAVGAVLLLVSLFIDWYDPGGDAWAVFESLDLAARRRRRLRPARRWRRASAPAPSAARSRSISVAALRRSCVVQLLDPPPVVTRRRPRHRRLAGARRDRAHGRRRAARPPRASRSPSTCAAASAAGARPPSTRARAPRRRPRPPTAPTPSPRGPGGASRAATNRCSSRASRQSSRARGGSAAHPGPRPGRSDQE